MRLAQRWQPLPKIRPETDIRDARPSRSGWGISTSNVVGPHVPRIANQVDAPVQDSDWAGVSRITASLIRATRATARTS